MPNGLFQALRGQQRPQMPAVNPAEYRSAIQQQINAYQQQGRNPTQEFEALVQSGKIPARQLAMYRQIGHAVAARLFGGN